MNASKNKHQEPPNFVAELHDFKPHEFKSGAFEKIGGLRSYPEPDALLTCQASEMDEILARIRMQLHYIIHSIRCWQERDARTKHPLRRRYSAYEGTMCHADLRRHWAYYRHAMAEYTALRRL